MVAKSYQALQQNGEPFIENGRMYVEVVMKNGAIKKVRWYTNQEWNKMYPNEPMPLNKRPLKNVLGFKNGYITIFKDKIAEDNAYLMASSARYHCIFGWYFISDEPLPFDIPQELRTVRLNWNMVGNEDGTCKSDSEIARAVEQVAYDPDPSEFQGEVGRMIEVTVTVESAETINSYYGMSTTHIMRDKDENCYVWTTAARCWSADSEHHIKGTVKEHSFTKNIKRTVLTRCREI